MNKKIFATVALCMVLTLCTVGLVACNNGNNSDKDQVTVTFYDATDSANLVKLKDVKVDKGSTVESYTPTKDGGYEFVNWFAVPSKNHAFDFGTAINEDTNVYAGFTLFKNDTREFYVVGSGTSELLFQSNWGKVLTDAHKMTKDASKNEYTIQMDVKQGDEFQFVINSDWANKRGYGYMSTSTLTNGTAAFEGQGSVYDESSKGSNIKCVYSGNYKFTLKTYPNEDYYNENGTGYTEERKEIYNVGLYDKIEWTRVGDVVNDVVTVTNYYIKGKNITGWKDMYNAATQMVANGDVHTLKVYLKKNDEFMFTSRVTKIENGESTASVGSEYIKANVLTEASKEYLGSTTSNMTAKADGEYTFTYNSTSKELSVTFDSSKAPAAYKYYLDGNFNGGNYGDFITKPDDFKMTETPSGSGVYAIKGVTFDEGKEFLIRSYAVEDTADWNHTHIDFQFAYLAPNAAFEVASATNNNIKIKTAGTYDVSFDSYSKMITIVNHVEADPADTLDIYIKGSGINNWNHGFSADYVMTLSADKTTYEYTLTVAANSTVEFGLEKHTKGEKEGYGDYLGLSALGSSGDANSSFTLESGANFKCSTAGTYKIVYNIETGKVDFYAATNA